MRTLALLLAILPIGLQAVAASKPHVVSLEKVLCAVKLFLGLSEDKMMDITVRGLYVMLPRASAPFLRRDFQAGSRGFYSGTNRPGSGCEE